MDYGAIGMLKQVDKSVLNLVGHRVLKVFNTEVTKSELYFRGNKRKLKLRHVQMNKICFN